VETPTANDPFARQNATTPDQAANGPAPQQPPPEQKNDDEEDT
jgi:hypothetical protein